MADDQTRLDVPLDDLVAFSRQLEAINRSAADFSKLLTTGLKAAVVDGKSLESVMKSIALTVSSRLVTNALAPLEGLAGTMLSQMSSAIAGSLSAGVTGTLSSITPFAKGGVVASPAFFPLPGGGGGLGLMGEEGPEAVMPLRRGADGRLGVAAGTPSGTQQPQSIVVNVVARDLESFRRSEAQVSALVARAVGRGRRGL